MSTSVENETAVTILSVQNAKLQGLFSKKTNKAANVHLEKIQTETLSTQLAWTVVLPFTPVKLNAQPAIGETNVLGAKSLTRYQAGTETAANVLKILLTIQRLIPVRLAAVK